MTKLSVVFSTFKIFDPHQKEQIVTEKGYLFVTLRTGFMKSLILNTKLSRLCLTPGFDHTSVRLGHVVVVVLLIMPTTGDNIRAVSPARTEGVHMAVESDRNDFDAFGADLLSPRLR